MSDETNTDSTHFNGFETIPLRVWICVGQARCSLSRLAGLQAGEILELSQKVGEPFEMRSGGVLLGHVEPVAEKDAVAIKLIRIPGDDDALGD